MTQQSSAIKHLVLVGGGHSHAIVLKLMAENVLPAVHVTVIFDTTLCPYSGMLPGLIAGYYSFEEAHIDIRRITLEAGASFTQGKVIGVNLDTRAVLLADNTTMNFDLLSLNIGSTPPLGRVPGAREHTIPVKPVPEFLHAWDRILAEQHKGQRSKICIVGGGAGGVELAFSMRQRLGKESAVHLVHNEMELLPAHPLRVRRLVNRRLIEAGVQVSLETAVTSFEASALRTADGNSFLFDQCVWATGASAPDWLHGTGLALDNRGFIQVKNTLQSLSHDFVFAVGDIASFIDQQRPKAGVYAVRQGKPLYQNLYRLLSGQRPIEHKFQKSFLSLIGTTQGRAIGSRGGSRKINHVQ